MPSLNCDDDGCGDDGCGDDDDDEVRSLLELRR